MKIRKIRSNVVQNDFHDFHRQQRNQLAAEVATYCIGRPLKEVARLIGQTEEWVGDLIDLFGVLEVLGKTQYEDLEFLAKHVPDCQLVEDDDGNMLCVGEDSEELEPLIDRYFLQGYEPEIAFRISKAAWAAGAKKYTRGVLA